jgi:hypothetical protein
VKSGIKSKKIENLMVTRGPLEKIRDEGQTCKRRSNLKLTIESHNDAIA